MIVLTGHCLNCDKHYAHAVSSIYDQPDYKVHNCEGESNE